MARVSITSLRAKIKRAWARRKQGGNIAARALRVQQRARRAIQRERAARLARHSVACPKPLRTYRSSKSWQNRPLIQPKQIVLHSTESNPGSGDNVSAYLAHPDVQADCHVVIDSNGDVYRLVPDGRKAWHVAQYNSTTLGIEQVGRATQKTWPDAQLRVVARQVACWSRRYRIPIRDARGQGTSGVVTHSSLGVKGGNHNDPGPAYPFDKVIALAKKYR